MYVRVVTKKKPQLLTFSNFTLQIELFPSQVNELQLLEKVVKDLNIVIMSVTVSYSQSKCYANQ